MRQVFQYLIYCCHWLSLDRHVSDTHVQPSRAFVVLYPEVQMKTNRIYLFLLSFKVILGEFTLECHTNHLLYLSTGLWALSIIEIFPIFVRPSFIFLPGCLFAFLIVRSRTGSAKPFGCLGQRSTRVRASVVDDIFVSAPASRFQSEQPYTGA